jgi:hypothetical protein
MKRLSIAVVAILSFYSCKKEQAQLELTSVSSDDSRTIGTPYYAFTPWALKTAPVNYECKTSTEASVVRKALEYMYNHTYTNMASLKKWTSGSSMDMQDPCGIEGTCGSTSGGNTTFVITFTFYTPTTMEAPNWVTPDYTGYLSITENKYHEIISVTFDVKLTGDGVYGSLEPASDPMASFHENPSGGYDIAFDYHGLLSTSIGLGKYTAHARPKFEMNGWLHVDRVLNPTYGKAYVKPY